MGTLTPFSPPAFWGDPSPAPLPAGAVGMLGMGTALSPGCGHPTAAQGQCPCVGPSPGVTRGPWGPSPSAAARGLPWLPWIQAALPCSPPLLLRSPPSRIPAPARGCGQRLAAGRGWLLAELMERAEEGEGAARGHPRAGSAPRGRQEHAASSSPAAVGAFLGILSRRRRNLSQEPASPAVRGHDLLPATAAAGHCQRRAHAEGPCARPMRRQRSRWCWVGRGLEGWAVLGRCPAGSHSC